MKAEGLRSYLTHRAVNFTEKKIPHGTQFRCSDGEMLVVYDKGTFLLQGKQTPLTDEIKAWERLGCKLPLDAGIGGAGDKIAAKAHQPVFIVYGHDEDARNALELLLRRMGLEPIVLQNLPAAGDTVIEKLERYIGQHGKAGFSCVLLTPDDEGYKAGFNDAKRYRARQNVVLELGMVLAKLGRRHVAILHKESVELPSDIAGLIYIPFKRSPDEVRNKLFQELRNVGYEPNADAL